MTSAAPTARRQRAIAAAAADAGRDGDEAARAGAAGQEAVGPQRVVGGGDGRAAEAAARRPAPARTAGGSRGDPAVEDERGERVGERGVDRAGQRCADVGQQVGAAARPLTPTADVPCRHSGTQSACLTRAIFDAIGTAKCTAGLWPGSWHAMARRIGLPRRLAQLYLGLFAVRASAAPCRFAPDSALTPGTCCHQGLAVHLGLAIGTVVDPRRRGGAAVLDPAAAVAGPRHGQQRRADRAVDERGARRAAGRPRARLADRRAGRRHPALRTGQRPLHRRTVRPRTPRRADDRARPPDRALAAAGPDRASSSPCWRPAGCSAAPSASAPSPMRWVSAHSHSSSCAGSTPETGRSRSQAAPSAANHASVRAQSLVEVDHRPPAELAGDQRGVRPAHPRVVDRQVDVAEPDRAGLGGSDHSGASSSIVSSSGLPMLTGPARVAAGHGQDPAHGVVDVADRPGLLPVAGDRHRLTGQRLTDERRDGAAVVRRASADRRC